MNVKIAFTLVALSALAACKTVAPVTETRYKTITVTKRGPCPDAGTYNRLKAGRPTPLRNQARPRTGVERTARTSAQLGLYEREGGWADQVSAALDRCQIAEKDEGVADIR